MFLQVFNIFVIVLVYFNFVIFVIYHILDIFSLEAYQGNAFFGDMHCPFEGNADMKILFGNDVLFPSQSRKSLKLNSKRIGAAWAEKRREELEKEKREGIAIIYDPNWLPNFGGVWQTGTRKESRKEFEIEKIKRIKTDKQFEAPILQPYISKRMVRSFIIFYFSI